MTDSSEDDCLAQLCQRAKKWRKDDGVANLNQQRRSAMTSISCCNHGFSSGHRNPIQLDEILTTDENEDDEIIVVMTKKISSSNTANIIVTSTATDRNGMSIGTDSSHNVSRTPRSTVSRTDFGRMVGHRVVDSNKQQSSDSDSTDYKLPSWHEKERRVATRKDQGMQTINKCQNLPTSCSAREPFTTITASCTTENQDDKTTYSHPLAFCSSGERELSRSNDDSSTSLSDYEGDQGRVRALLPSIRYGATLHKGGVKALKRQGSKHDRTRSDDQRLLKEQARQAKRLAQANAKMSRRQERESKRAAIQEEKADRKRRREKAAQESGKHAKKEIAVLMDSGLYRHASLALVHDMREDGFHVQEYPSGFGCHAIQFIRKDFMSGGATDAVQKLYASDTTGYTHLPIMVVLFDAPHDFLKLLQRCDETDENGNNIDSDLDDYPALEKWLEGLIVSWRAAWQMKLDERPRILVYLPKLFESLDRLWVSHRKRGAKRAEPVPPTTEELQDAMTWLLVQFQVECVHLCSNEDLSTHLRKLTRLLAEEPYQKQTTVMDCVRKLKAQCSDFDPDLDRAMDCWKRQLQQIPHVSMNTASRLVQYYPTARSLWLEYQNPNLSQEQKRLLLADICGNGRRQGKLSEMIYRVVTSNNPSEIIR